MEIGILIVGILAGVMSGLFGIGGGIVMVPTLIAIFGMNMLDANATSLAAMLLPVGIFGVMNYYKAGYINLKDSLWIALGLFGGSFFGAELAVTLDVNLLAKLYAAYLLWIAVGYFDIPSYFSRNKNKKQTNDIKAKTHRAVWQFIFIGVLAGVIAGMFGKVAVW